MAQFNNYSQFCEQTQYLNDNFSHLHLVLILFLMLKLLQLRLRLQDPLDRGLHLHLRCVHRKVDYRNGLWKKKSLIVCVINFLVARDFLLIAKEERIISRVQY